MINTLKKPAIFLLFIFFCFSCTRKEDKPEITMEAKGLKYDNIILKLNRDTLKSNEVDFEKDLILNVFGLTGFNETVGNIYLGCSLVLSDESGAEIMKYNDLYSYYDVSGIYAADIRKKFSISLSISPPLKKGNSYTWKSRIWDKKGTGEINTELKFKVKNTK